MEEKNIMKLDSNSYKEKKQWEEKGYQLGDYSRDEMIERTLENPSWVHFGAGNIFRAFHENLAEKLLEEENYDRGIVVVEGFDYEIIEKMYRPHDNLSILVTLKSDGSVQGLFPCRPSQNNLRSPKASQGSDPQSSLPP